MSTQVHRISQCQTQNFHSYFLSFDEGCRLELMKMPNIPDNANNVMSQSMGLIHFAMSLGSREKVDILTERLRADGYKVIGEPRVIGDGYYESVVLDPENNRVEITECFLAVGSCENFVF